MLLIWPWSALLISSVWASTAGALGSGMDGYGDHNIRKAANYHFHKGPLAGRTFELKAEKIAVLIVTRKLDKIWPSGHRGKTAVGTPATTSRLKGNTASQCMWPWLHQSSRFTCLAGLSRWQSRIATEKLALGNLES